jgi:hypothetical protein
VHERSFEMTVNASRRVLPKLKELDRGIARIAKQEEVWIEYGRKAQKVTADFKLRHRK